jgi:hypothetical protein
MDNEELIQSFRTMIEELQANQKQLSEKLDGILNEASTAKRNYDKEQFVGRNKDFFDKYRDTLGVIEGKDFDLDEVAFSGKGDMDEAEYIAALSSKIDEQLKEYAKALKSFSGEDVAEVEAKAEDTDADGEPDTTTIESDKTEDEKPAESVAEEPTEEEKEPAVEMDDEFKKSFAARYR